VQWILYGTLMILILMFLPKGIVPSFSKLARRRVARPALASREATQ